MRDVVATLCGGTAWHPALLAVIVTSRESRLGERGVEGSLFGRGYQRLLMLPFSKARVRTRLHTVNHGSVCLVAGVEDAPIQLCGFALV